MVIPFPSATFPIHYYPESQILITRAPEIANFSDPAVYKILVDSMIKTMKAHCGIGLAAPQAGMSIRMFVADVNDGCEAFFNPTIIDKSKKELFRVEACLSIPGLAANIKRNLGVTVQYQDERGRWHVRDVEGMLARVVQHEIDHLDGWLFPFYLIPGAKKGEFKPLVWSLRDELTNNRLELLSE